MTDLGSTIDLVIFDCDGVLVDSEIISAGVLIEQLAQAGVKVDLDHVQRNFLGRSFPTVAADIRRSFGLTLPDDFEQSYRARLLARFESELRPTAGVEQVLANLAPPKCVATSSSPPRVARTLELAGLARLFGQKVFTASEVANGKPAPDLFLHAAASMAVSPSRCLVIEDSLPGIEAATAAGMRVWWFAGGSHLSEPGVQRPVARPDVPVFDKWSEFFDMAPDLMIERTPA